MRTVCLAGGVGGAKLADGLQRVLAPGELTVVVNTGDDFERHGLEIWPDHDTVLYTLAGIADAVQGWGIAGETWQVMEQLSALGEETWFRLGDRDIATHLFRTPRLRAGVRPTEVALALQGALGVPTRILPMADEPVRTQVRVADATAAETADATAPETADATPGATNGWLPFQDYFVRLRQAPEVLEVDLAGIGRARATPEVREAFEAAEAIVFAPSNPIVSLGPILAVPGMSEALADARGRGVRSVAVSGIVGGHALKGPADRMLASLGEESSALGVARRLAGLIDVFVIDRLDEALAPAIRALGLEVVVTDTIMTDVAARARLAAEVLAVARASEAAR